MRSSDSQHRRRHWIVAIILLTFGILKDEHFCQAALGVVPVELVDFLEQLQTTTPPPLPHPPPASNLSPPLPPPPSPTLFSPPVLPAVEPLIPATQPPSIPLQEPSASEPLAPPPPVQSVTQDSPNTQQLMQLQEIIQQQKRQLQKLKQDIENQKQALLQMNNNPPPPQPSLPLPPQPFTSLLVPPPTSLMQSSFPAPNYQFKSPMPPPPPQQPPSPPPPRLSPSGLPLTKDGYIDFIPPEHKALRPPPPPPPPTSPRRTLVGGVPTHWYARQVTAPGQPPHHHPQSIHSNAAPLPRPYNPNSALSRYGPGPLSPHFSNPPPPTRPAHPFSRMPLPRTMQAQAMKMGRKMCLTQFYESHGCIDPVKHLPPGTTSQGLMMGCSSHMSRALCQTAGARVPGGMGRNARSMAMMTMMMDPSSKAMLEKCLTPNSVTSSVMNMMKSGGGRGGINPAAMMMMAGGGGEGGGGMAALAMMNMMKQRQSTSAGGSLLDSAAGGGAEGGGEGGPDCRSVLMMMMAQGIEGGILSPEMFSTVSDMRKQMLPYTCQEVNKGVFFRMCCPGKVHSPTMMEMMTHCGG